MYVNDTFKPKVFLKYKKKLGDASLRSVSQWCPFVFGAGEGTKPLTRLTAWRPFRPSRCPPAHRSLKKQSTGLFFLTALAHFGFKSLLILTCKYKRTPNGVLLYLVRAKGLEPLRQRHWLLRPTCLPFHHACSKYHYI